MFVRTKCSLKFLYRSKCSIALIACMALFCILDDIGRLNSTFSMNSKVLAHSGGYTMSAI